jgi:rhomboid family GlyGly-CTERM serine protease
LTAPGRAWVALAALFALGSLLAWWLPAAAIDWQPGLASTQPWRAWTAAWVHWSPMHLGANLAGSALVAAFGWTAQLPPRAAWAWFAAWPLTQFGLLLQPELAHYGGLSGVLHAGAVAAALYLLLESRAPRRRRAIGAAVLAGAGVKLLLEEPWAEPLRHVAGWDIALAPLAHASGAAAGLLCMLAAVTLPRPARRV